REHPRSPQPRVRDTTMPQRRKSPISVRPRTALTTEQLEGRDQPAGLGLGLSGLLPALDVSVGLGASAAHDPPGLAVAAAATVGAAGHGHDVVTALSVDVGLHNP